MYNGVSQEFIDRNYPLPVPKWEVMENTIQTLVNGSPYQGVQAYARIPLLSPDVRRKVANLRLEFGLARGRRHTVNSSLRTRGRRITAWSNWNGVTGASGTGFGGGEQYNNLAIPMPARPNRFTFTGNDKVGPLPYAKFYNEYTDEVLTDVGIMSNVVTVAISGGKVSKLMNPNNYLSGGGYYDKTPQSNNMFVTLRHRRSEWFCRIIELDPNNLNRVISVGAWSEALIITPPMPSYNAFRSEGSSTTNTKFELAIERRRNV